MFVAGVIKRPKSTVSIFIEKRLQKRSIGIIDLSQQANQNVKVEVIY